MLYIYHMNAIQMYYLNDDSLAFDRVYKLKEALSRRLSISETDIMLLKDSRKLRDDEILSHYEVGLVESNPIYAYTSPTLNPVKCPIVCQRDEFKTQLDLVQRETSFKSHSSFHLRSSLRNQIIERVATLHNFLKSVSTGILHHNKAWSSLLLVGKSLEAEVKTHFEIFFQAYQEKFKTSRNVNQKDTIAKLGETLKLLSNYSVPDALSRIKRSRKLLFAAETAKRRRVSSSSCEMPAMFGDLSFSDEEEPAPSENSPSLSPIYSIGLDNALPHESWYQPVDNLYSLLFAESSQDVLSRAEMNILMENKVDHAMLEEIEAEVLHKYEAEVRKLYDRCDISALALEVQKLFTEFEQILEIQTRFYQRASNEMWSANDPEIMEKAKRDVSDLLAMNERLNMQVTITKSILEIKDRVIAQFDGLLWKYAQCCQKLHKSYDKIRSYHELLTRKQMSMQAVDFMTQLPSVIFLGLAELIRRRIYSKNFMRWAEPLQLQVNELLQKEVSKRNRFQTVYKKFSFLRLFDGLDAEPSKYASTKPINPDELLPELSDEDLEMLISKWPSEFKHLLPELDDVDVPSLLKPAITRPTLKSRPYNRSSKSVKDLEQVVPHPGNHNIAKRLVEDEYQFEEETGSDDCDKQECLDLQVQLHKIDSVNQRTCKGSTEGLEDRLHQLIQTNDKLQSEIKQLKTKLETTNEEKSRLQETFDSEVNRIASDRIEAQMEVLKKKMQEEKEQEIKQSTSLLQAQHDLNYLMTFKEKEKQLRADFEAEKEALKAAMKAEMDQLKEKQKTDFEALRQRFKMMTTANMDKSPSETSLSDFEVGKLQADAMLKNLREEMLAEMDVQLASQKEAFEIQLSNKESYYRKQREADFKKIEKEQQAELQKALQNVKKDKDDLLSWYQEQIIDLKRKLEETEMSTALIDSQRRDIKLLTSENRRMKKIYKEVQRMRVSGRSEYNDRSTILNFFEICGLKQEMTGVLDALEVNMPIQMNYNVNLVGCAPDEIVIFYWSPENKAFRAFITGPLSLLDPSCHPFFNIKEDPSQNRTFYLAEIIRQEYSATKKVGNRFHLSLGAVFYRVYARPPGSSFLPKEPRKKYSVTSKKVSSPPPQSSRRRTESEGDIQRLETFRSRDIRDDVPGAMAASVASGSPSTRVPMQQVCEASVLTTTPKFPMLGAHTEKLKTSQSLYSPSAPDMQSFKAESEEESTSDQFVPASPSSVSSESAQFHSSGPQSVESDSHTLQDNQSNA